MNFSRAHPRSTRTLVKYFWLYLSIFHSRCPKSTILLRSNFQVSFLASLQTLDTYFSNEFLLCFVSRYPKFEWSEEERWKKSSINRCPKFWVVYPGKTWEFEWIKIRSYGHRSTYFSWKIGVQSFIGFYLLHIVCSVWKWKWSIFKTGGNCTVESVPFPYKPYLRFTVGMHP